MDAAEEVLICAGIRERNRRSAQAGLKSSEGLSENIEVGCTHVSEEGERRREGTTRQRGKGSFHGIWKCEERGISKQSFRTEERELEFDEAMCTPECEETRLCLRPLSDVV